MKPIRVGMINCDLHAIYYAALFAEHDPLKLRGPDLVRSKPARDSWQNGGAHFYHYLYYGNPRHMTAPHVPGLTLARIWDKDRELAEIAAELFTHTPRVCDTFAEASDDVDLVFIADCNGDGSNHLKLAAPGLMKRVPTFVDKPFAYDIKDACAIVALAQKKRVPVLSMSILRSVPEAALFAKRLPEVGPLAFGTIRGGGIAMNGHIHASSMAQHIFGNGVAAVEAMGKNELGHMHLIYPPRKDRPTHGVTLSCDTGPTWHCAFYASAYGPEGAAHSGPISDFVFPKGAAINVQLAKKMARSGKSPVPYDDMLENIAVASAARRAQKTGRAVTLAGVWKKRKP